MTRPPGDQRADDGQGVRRAVEKIRIAEGDVFGADGDLGADIAEDDGAIDDTEGALVDGDDWAMTAKMFAAARGFGVADDAAGAVGHAQARVIFEVGEAGAVGKNKLLAGEGDYRLGLPLSLGFILRAGGAGVVTQSL